MIQGFEFKKDEEKVQELAKKVVDRAKEILEGNDVTVDDLKRVSEAVSLIPKYNNRLMSLITDLYALLDYNYPFTDKEVDTLIRAKIALIRVLDLPDNMFMKR